MYCAAVRLSVESIGGIKSDHTYIRDVLYWKLAKSVCKYKKSFEPKTVDGCLPLEHYDGENIVWKLKWVWSFQTMLKKFFKISLLPNLFFNNRSFIFQIKVSLPKIVFWQRKVRRTLEGENIVWQRKWAWFAQTILKGSVKFSLPNPLNQFFNIIDN